MTLPIPRVLPQGHDRMSFHSWLTTDFSTSHYGGAAPALTVTKAARVADPTLLTEAATLVTFHPLRSILTEIYLLGHTCFYHEILPRCRSWRCDAS